jgi:hypothetical protein
LVALAVVGSAHAASPVVDRAAAALRSDPVYIDPKAQFKPQAVEERELRARIRSSRGGAIYVAILPGQAAAEAGGDADAVVRLLRERLGRPGTYAVVVGAELRAASGDLPSGKAQQLADEAYGARHEQGVGRTLLDFVDRVERARTGRSGGGGSGTAAVVGAVVGGIAAFAAAVAGLVVLRRRWRRTEGLRQARRAVRDDLAYLAEDARELERRGLSPDAEAAYASALACYERAERASDRARSPADLEPVAATVAEGRYELARASALLAGREPPERRPPCFFDPRHGPAVREVEWSSRVVAACEADARRIDRGAEPETRHVLANGKRVPYWSAPPAFDGWRTGYYGPDGRDRSGQR